MSDATRPKIVIEFVEVLAALEWFDGLRAAGHVPADCELYQADGLDMARGGDMRTFLVRSAGDRPDGMAVRNRLPALMTRAERDRTDPLVLRGAAAAGSARTATTPTTPTTTDTSPETP
ncbi:hypothetical protein [Saccharothrix sp. HUAS TT1]|uniref:hypothetical protein n=1 Tax=unclassified Saccharothrix TaxID=2593673 RepID=UPI00345C21F8